MTVYHALDGQGFIHTPTRVKLDFDTLAWSPITYNKHHAIQLYRKG